MKKIIYLLVFIINQQIGFSQAKLSDGIYLIDELSRNHITSRANRAFIQFNPYFVEEEPEVYEPIVIATDEFVPFELTDMPVIQEQQPEDNLLIVHLTENAAEKLWSFTSRNMMNHIAVVVNGQALAIYKVTQPISNQFIKIAKCNGDACYQIYRRLKNTVKI